MSVSAFYIILISTCIKYYLNLICIKVNSFVKRTDMIIMIQLWIMNITSQIKKHKIKTIFFQKYIAFIFILKKQLSVISIGDIMVLFMHLVI